MHHRLSFLAAALVTAALAACSPAELGGECETDDQCATGLRCLAVEEQLGDQCAERRFCTVSCAEDADCAAQGDGVACITFGCQEASTCEDCVAGACLVGSSG